MICERCSSIELTRFRHIKDIIYSFIYLLFFGNLLLKSAWLKNELAWHFWTWLSSDSKSINWSIVAICVQWPADLHYVSVHLQHNTVDCAQTRTKSIFVHACEVSSEEDILHLKLLPAHSYLLLQKRLNVQHTYFSQLFILGWIITYVAHPANE